MPMLTTPYMLNAAQFDKFQLPYNIGGNTLAGRVRRLPAAELEAPRAQRRRSDQADPGPARQVRGGPMEACGVHLR